MTTLARHQTTNISQLIVCGLVLASVALALPGALILAREDGHADAKHGESAKIAIQRAKPQEREVWYSAKREAAMIVWCDCASQLCATMYIGMRGTPLSASSFTWTDMDGRLELTHLWQPANRCATVARRDGYVRIYSPVPIELYPPIWERCRG